MLNGLLSLITVPVLSHARSVTSGQRRDDGWVIGCNQQIGITNQIYECVYRIETQMDDSFRRAEKVGIRIHLERVRTLAFDLRDLTD